MSSSTIELDEAFESWGSFKSGLYRACDP